MAIARKEARFAQRCWNFQAEHTPSHIGFPPNECADILAFMGRKRFHLSQRTEEVLRNVPTIQIDQQPAVVFSLHDALFWTAAEEASIPSAIAAGERAKDVIILKVASANVLTLHPADEARFAEQGCLDSHRRLDLAAQFQRFDYTVVGIQETRLRRPRAFPIGPYAAFAAASGDRGQAGIELWIRENSCA